MLAIKSLDNDTLQYQLGSRPFTQQVDMSAATVYQVSGAIRSYLKKTESLPPESEALQFYYMNHVLSEVQARTCFEAPLPLDVLPLVEDYNKYGTSMAARMFFYLLIICFRECRHIKNLSSFTGAISGASYKAVLSISGSGSSTAMSAIRNWEGSHALTVGTLTKNMLHLFTEGSWSGGYGGKAWANIAQVLHSYVIGDLSAELMLDTAFSLSHNNGAIFNKGILYEHHSHTLVQILDVQRAGLVPEAVNESHFTKYMTYPLKTYAEASNDALGTIGKEYIDWFTVEALGAVSDCSDKQEYQCYKYGVPDSQKEILAKQKEASKKAALLQAKKEAEDAMTQSELEDKYFFVTGTEKAEKITMERADA